MSNFIFLTDVQFRKFGAKDKRKRKRTVNKSRLARITGQSLALGTGAGLGIGYLAKKVLKASISNRRLAGAALAGSAAGTVLGVAPAYYLSKKRPEYQPPNPKERERYNKLFPYVK